MKNIITKLTQAGGVLVLALVLGIGASVFAVNYAGPTSTPPGNNAPVPINVETGNQVKGDPAVYPAGTDLLTVGGSFKANNLKAITSSTLFGNTTIGNFFSGEKLNVQAPAFFSNGANNAQVKIGGTATTFTRGGRTPALTFDLAARSGWDGHDFLHVQTNQSNISSTGDTANLSSNSKAFGFWSDKNSRYADIWAGLPRFERGNPNNGDVLAAYDTNGNANWGTINTGLDIKRIRAYKSGAQFTCEDDCELNSEANAFALCPSGYSAIGGGGDCEKQAIQVSQSIVNTSANNPFNTGVDPDPGQPGSQVGLATGWYIQCKSGGSGSSSYGDVHVEVICAKNSNPTVSVSDPNAGTTTTPPPPAATWHDTTGEGTARMAGLSYCQDWASTLPGYTSMSNVHTFKQNSFGGWDDLGSGCAYEYQSSGGWYCETPAAARTSLVVTGGKLTRPTSSCNGNSLNMKTMIYY